MSADEFLLLVKPFTVFHLNNFVSHLWRPTPVNPLRQHHDLHAADVTGHFAALSGISRNSRVATVSIQRFFTRVPPVISAGNLQNLQ